MLQVGTVEALKKNEESGFLEVQVKGIVGKTDWFPLINFSGIETRPMIGDTVVLHLNADNKGPVLHGLAKDDFTEEPYEMRTKQRADKEVIKRYINKDDETIFDIKPQEVVYEKEVQLENVPTGTTTIDGISRTTYGLYINGDLRYFPDMS